jgi:hypothetical protein
MMTKIKPSLNTITTLALLEKILHLTNSFPCLILPNNNLKQLEALTQKMPILLEAIFSEEKDLLLCLIFNHRTVNSFHFNKFINLALKKFFDEAMKLKIDFLSHVLTQTLSQIQLILFYSFYISSQFNTNIHL